MRYLTRHHVVWGTPAPALDSDPFPPDKLIDILSTLFNHFTRGKIIIGSEKIKGKRFLGLGILTINRVAFLEPIIRDAGYYKVLFLVKPGNCSCCYKLWAIIDTSGLDSPGSGKPKKGCWHSPGELQDSTIEMWQEFMQFFQKVAVTDQRLGMFEYE